MLLVDEIKMRLDALEPVNIHIEDESALHAGHQGNNGGGHFKLTITSAKFNELSLIKRHQMIYQLVNDLIPNKIHALSITAHATQP